MLKFTKIILGTTITLALIIVGMFAFGRDTALANFVTNAWQGYKLTEGLVGYWGFDGRDMDLASSTREVYDRSGQGNNGDLKNHSTTTTIGKSGQALSFDGSDDHVSLGVLSGLNGAASAAFSFWVRHTGFGATQEILVKGSNSSTWVQLAFVNGIGFIIDTEGAARRATFAMYSTVVPVNVWAHITVVYDGVSKVTGASGAVAPTNNSAYIGTWFQVSDVTRYFDGDIDDIRIYNRALSLEEVKRLYLMGK